MAWRRRDVGLLLARVGSALMALGGLADLTIRELLPNHREWLGFATTAVPEATETLVLALLHALGAALAAGGVAAFALLGVAHREGRTVPAVLAVFVVALGEGMNSVGMYRTGSPYFVVPLASLLLVVTGATLYLSVPRQR